MKMKEYEVVFLLINVYNYFTYGGLHSLPLILYIVIMYLQFIRNREIRIIEYQLIGKTTEHIRQERLRIELYRYAGSFCFKFYHLAYLITIALNVYQYLVFGISYDYYLRIICIVLIPGYAYYIVHSDQNYL